MASWFRLRGLTPLGLEAFVRRADRECSDPEPWGRRVGNLGSYGQEIFSANSDSSGIIPLG